MAPVKVEPFPRDSKPITAPLPRLCYPRWVAEGYSGLKHSLSLKLFQIQLFQQISVNKERHFYMLRTVAY